jgi:hypothetical protein
MFWNVTAARHQRIHILLCSIGAIVGAIAGLLGGHLGAHAYNNNTNTSCKWAYSGGASLVYPKYAFDTGQYAPTGLYVTAYENARVNWDASSSPVWFVNVAGSINYVWQVRV